MSPENTQQPQPQVYGPAGQPPQQPPQQSPTAQQSFNGQPTDQQESDKEFLAAVLFAWFLGGFGADRFYLGKTGTAIAKLLTLGGFGIWALIDVVMLVFGKTRDKQGLPLKDYHKYKKAAKITFFILLAMQIISLLLFGLTFLATINELQNGDASSGGGFSSMQTKTKDLERRTDINMLHSQMEQFYFQHERYPSFSEMNDSTFRQQKMSGLDTEALKDPDGFDDYLVLSPAPGSYSYMPMPSNCSDDCTSYTLSATLSDNTKYTKNSLN